MTNMVSKLNTPSTWLRTNLNENDESLKENGCGSHDKGRAVESAGSNNRLLSMQDSRNGAYDISGESQKKVKHFIIHINKSSYDTRNFGLIVTRPRNKPVRPKEKMGLTVTMERYSWIIEYIINFSL